MMRSDIEICVKKQVKIVNKSLVSNDCPRLSVDPGSDSYIGFKYYFWGGRIVRKPKTPLNPIGDRMNSSSSSCVNSNKVKLKHRQLTSSSNLRYCKSKSKPRRLWLSGFFQAQLRMMKSSKHQRKKGNLSSNISVHNQFSNNYQISSISCPVSKKHKGKMTLFNTYSPILKKHRKMPDNFNHLPEELLAEILRRLPVKYILRCRCVQKSWHSLIQSPMFITLQLNYQKKNIASHHHYKYLFFRYPSAIQSTIRLDDVQCQEYCKIQFPPGLPKHAWFAVSYGLVCVSSTLRFDDDDYNRNIYLWNPLIQKYKTLPDSPLPSKQDWEEWEALAFGFVPEVNDYVVVHIIQTCLHPTPHSLIIGVYSLNSNSWKKFRRDNVFIASIFINNNDVVFINGAAYWVVFNSDENKILMCFDTKTDILSEISLPDWVEQDHIPVIYPFGQSIAYFVWESQVNHWDMWVLIDDLINGFVWEKKMCVSVSEDVREEVLGVRNNGEPILAKINNLIAYNLESHEANDFVDSWDCWTPEEPFEDGLAPPFVISPFVESLVLFDID